MKAFAADLTHRAALCRQPQSDHTAIHLRDQEAAEYRVPIVRLEKNKTELHRQLYMLTLVMGFIAYLVIQPFHHRIGNY